MLRFATYLLNDDEEAFAYRDGDDMLIVINESVTDPQRRCEVVNNLLRRLSTAALRPAA